MPIVILALLKREDMYGYQLVQECCRSSGERIITQEGSLYPVLYKLQEQGYISDRRVQVGKRMTRIYYHIEPSGEVYLQDLLKDYQAIVDGITSIMEGQKDA